VPGAAAPAGLDRPALYIGLEFFKIYSKLETTYDAHAMEDNTQSRSIAGC
jgi:hypothetical protein